MPAGWAKSTRSWAYRWALLSLMNRIFTTSNIITKNTLTRACTRQEAYAADITYGTNNEFGFDYLRDHMVRETDQLRQRDLHYAIVDEVDSILIDEARTPLIISAPATASGAAYQQFAKVVRQFKETEHYEKDEKRKSVVLTDAGVEFVEKILGITGLYATENLRTIYHLEQALKAQTLFH